MPFREHEVRRDDDALALVALGEQREQHLHFVAVVLHVADVVKNQALEAIQLCQLLRQSDIALCRKQPLHQGPRRSEQNGVALLDERVT